ncbi:unnamed protein product [Rotaria sordida]|uniref:guanylate cyclase n=1 Tax=Rotaria sordida TaxID=392033 RepID=A0A813WVT0_9BILA|nr:unnamed protein product [Rotaria sordida]CAF3649553.1 unnamed protein product [Rotaria sordida]
MNFEHESFTTLGRYDESLIERIAQTLSDILHEGEPDLYMQFFGESFVKFFTNYGYDKILRVAGRHFRDFLHSIDQLHDSTRFSFPKMKSPLFHVTDEDDNGAILHYKSKRRGFQRYIVGQLKECALRFFQEEISVRIQDDISTNEYTYIIFRVNFNNFIARSTQRRLMQGPKFPDLTSATFFKVFPFAILLDPHMRIFHMGDSIRNIFSVDTVLIGRCLNDVFRLVRPDIPLEWTKVLSYGRHIVFVIESIIPLRTNLSIFAKKFGSDNTLIRLKGQMKLITAWNMIAFLCHPILATTEDMLSVGLVLHDLHFYDGSSEILIAGMQHARTLQAAIDKQHAWITKLQSSKLELQEWRRKSKRLLYSIMPRHVAHMLQDGVVANSICESHKLITVLFGYSIDFKDIVQKLTPQQIVESINATVIAFDRCAEHFDVFKVETKADSSYMVVAGIKDRSVQFQRRESTGSYSSMYSVSMIDDLESTMKNPLGLNQAEIIAGLALELMKSSTKVINPVTKQPFRVQFGFHSGPAVGGIVGAKNFQYCLFGDTINTASRITTTGESGRIHLSSTSYALLKDSIYFHLQYRGKIELKGKGSYETYWLIGSTAAYISALYQASFDELDEEYTRPNFPQASMFENTSRINFDPTSDDYIKPVRRSSLLDIINKPTSIISGRCPFTQLDAIADYCYSSLSTYSILTANAILKDMNHNYMSIHLKPYSFEPMHWNSALLLLDQMNPFMSTGD